LIGTVIGLILGSAGMMSFPLAALAGGIIGSIVGGSTVLTVDAIINTNRFFKHKASVPSINTAVTDFSKDIMDSPTVNQSYSVL
jgi:ABC-type enterobactin transport system permease subunit